MIQNYIHQLLQLPLFKTFTAGNLQSWFRLYPYRIESYQKKDIIFNEGEVCQHIFVILSGQVQIQKVDASGRYFNVGIAEAGEMMGANVLFSNNSRYPLSTTALTPVSLLAMPKELVLKLCQVNSNFLERLLRVASQKAFLLTQRLNEVTVQTLRQNITRYLMSRYEEVGSEIHLPFTKTAWANELGVQRPSLSRELKKLQEEGLLTVKRDLITIHDPQTLRSYALS